MILKGIETARHFERSKRETHEKYSVPARFKFSANVTTKQRVLTVTKQ